MEHCMINGKRCHDCCKVLLIHSSYRYEEFVRKYPSNAGNYNMDAESDDYKNIADMLIPIKKRQAKKINPSLFKNPRKEIREWADRKDIGYFKCRHLVDGVCTNYENRPNMCSGYPYYGKTKEEFLETYSGAGEYNPDCTWFIDL